MTAILNQPTPSPLVSADRRWVYGRTAGWLRVTHADSGLTRDYYGDTSLDNIVNGHVPAGRLEADFRDLVLHHLHHPAARPEDRIAATKAAIALSMIGSQCVCGGYLTYTTGRRLAHLNLCRWCVNDPDGCPLGHEVPKVCATPAPVQCGHNQCRTSSQYGASGICGCDDECCGSHDGTAGR